jgi:transposase InsO family protein
LLVAIDKFSKWIEARPITSIRFEQAMLFFTDIVHRFGVPNCIITDNDTQFTGKKFLDFCDNHHIRVLWSAVAHPKTNGQVERANGMVLQGLKPRIFDKLNKHDKKWAAELPSVLWSLRMMPSQATGFTPFFLVYGSEDMLPTNIEYGSLRLKAYNKQNNDATREDARSRKLVMWLYYTQKDISKVSDAATTNTSVDGTSTSATWCYGEARTTRDVTSLLHHGKGHTSSRKY